MRMQFYILFLTHFSVDGRHAIPACRRVHLAVGAHTLTHESTAPWNSPKRQWLREWVKAAINASYTIFFSLHLFKCYCKWCLCLFQLLNIIIMKGIGIVEWLLYLCVSASVRWFPSAQNICIAFSYDFKWERMKTKRNIKITDTQWLCTHTHTNTQRTRWDNGKNRNIIFETIQIQRPLTAYGKLDIEHARTRQARELDCYSLAK